MIVQIIAPPGACTPSYARDALVGMQLPLVDAATLRKHPAIGPSETPNGDPLLALDRKTVVEALYMRADQSPIAAAAAAYWYGLELGRYIMIDPIHCEVIEE